MAAAENSKEKWKEELETSKKRTFKFRSHNFISPIVGVFIVESSIRKVYASKKRASSIITIIICKHLKFRSREDEKNATNANNLALSRDDHRPSVAVNFFFCGWRAHTKWCKLSCDVTYDDIHMQPNRRSTEKRWIQPAQLTRRQGISTNAMRRVFMSTSVSLSSVD